MTSGSPARLLLACLLCVATTSGAPLSVPTEGSWLRIGPEARTLHVLDGAIVEVSGTGRLEFRDGRRTIVVPKALRVAGPDGSAVASGPFSGRELRLVADGGEPSWVLRRVHRIPDEPGTRIRDEDGGDASVASEAPTRFYLRAGPGKATEFFHPASGRAEDAATRIERTLNRYAGYGLSGVVTWSDSSGNGPLTRAAGGRAGPASPPMDASTIFELGSLTKQLTAAAVLELEDRGALSVDDPLRRWHPELPEALGAIRLHDLLVHTSGLPEDLDVPADDVASVWQCLATVDLEAAPGTEWSYSNLGYVVLAAVVEETAGNGYRGLVRELVARSGVSDLGFPGDRGDWSTRHAVGGSGPLGTGRITKRRHIAPRGWDERLGASGAVGSIPALHAWFRALRAGRVLSPGATERMFEERPPEIAYGWFYLRAPDGSKRIAHGGDTEGFQTYLSYDPDADRVIAVGMNDRRGWRGPLLRALDAVLIEDSMPDLPPQVMSGETPLAEWTGTYALDDGSTVKVDTVAAHLRMAADGPGAIAMITGADLALADSLVEMTGRAADFLGELIEADTLAVEAWLAASGRSESFWNVWEHLTTDHAGAPPAFQVLGTVPDRAGRLVTFARIEFVDGEETLRLVWRPELDGWGTGGELPTRDFWPIGDGRLSSYDPTRPGWVELRLARTGDRRVLRDGVGREALRE